MRMEIDFPNFRTSSAPSTFANCGLFYFEYLITICKPTARLFKIIKNIYANINSFLNFLNETFNFYNTYVQQMEWN